MPLKLDGYLRVSRIGGREGEGYIAIPTQKDAIESYAVELGGEVVRWHKDEDQSGGNVERPAFQDVLARLRAGETDGLIVRDIDRFARSVADGANIVREIVDRGQVFASVVERIDPRSDEGRYMLNAYLNNGELFLNRIKSGWWNSKRRAVARGVHIGPTPLGYQRERSQPLVPHPIYGPAITDLYKRAATGEHGDTALAKWLDERAPREGGAPWQGSEVRRWLRNRVYLGEVRYGDLPPNTEAHPPLTDTETWELCQKKPGVQRRASSPFLLSGILRCASCRYAMGGQSNGGAKGNTPVYRCPGGRRCSERSVITAALVEGYVRGEALARLEGLRLEAAAEGHDLPALDQAVAEAEAELNAFASDLKARQVLGAAAWHDALELRGSDRDAKRAARDQAYAANRLVATAHSVKDLTHADLRDLLHGLVRFVFVRRCARGAPVADRVLIVWSDDPRDIEVPGPHRPGTGESVRW